MQEIQTPATITIDDLVKVDIRAGRIKAAEAVPKSELLKLQVDFGELGTRQVLARIGKHYTPESLIETTAAFVVNLPPREMKGQTSNGMILAAAHDDGVAVVTLPAIVKPGTVIG